MYCKRSLNINPSYSEDFLLVSILHNDTKLSKYSLNMIHTYVSTTIVYSYTNVKNIKNSSKHTYLILPILTYPLLMKS